MSPESIEVLVTKLEELLLSFAIRLIVGLIILFIGVKLAKFSRQFVEKALNRNGVESTLTSFISNTIYIALIVVVTIIALGQIGFKTASFLAVLGSAGLAIGLALQRSLSNLAAGVLLILVRPFKVGDYIEGGGAQGVIQEIQWFTTVLKSSTNLRIIIPNSKLFGDNIINYSSEQTRRIDLVFSVGYGDDLSQVKQLIETVLSEDERILKDPIPFVGVLQLADNSVNLAVRPWVKTTDYWPVYFSLQETMKKRFDAEGINIGN